MKILQVNSSIKGEASVSSRLAGLVSSRLASLVPGSEITIRDVTAQPVLDGAALGALFTPAENRTPEQAARAAVDDATIAQLQESDAVVIGVPLYNFGEPVQLKAWIDAIARTGVTFRYTAEGPVGLVTGKKVFVVFARGGYYKGTPNDTQTSWLKNVLGFLGMTEVTFLFAEGLNVGPEASAQALGAVEAEIAALTL
jgi:FMN-dependent NADH-azoreductase